MSNPKKDYASQVDQCKGCDRYTLYAGNMLCSKGIPEPRNNNGANCGYAGTLVKGAAICTKYKPKAN